MTCFLWLKKGEKTDLTTKMQVSFWSQLARTAFILRPFFLLEYSYHKHSKEAQMVACANNFTRSPVGFTAIHTPKTFLRKEKEKEIYK